MVTEKPFAARSPSLITEAYSGEVSPGPTGDHSGRRSEASAIRSGPEASTVTGKDVVLSAGVASSSAPSAVTVTEPASPGVAPVLLARVTGRRVSIPPMPSPPTVQVIVVATSVHGPAGAGSENAIASLTLLRSRVTVTAVATAAPWLWTYISIVLPTLCTSATGPCWKERDRSGSGSAAWAADGAPTSATPATSAAAARAQTVAVRCIVNSLRL
jgi:hypothetical protein